MINLCAAEGVFIAPRHLLFLNIYSLFFCSSNKPASFSERDLKVYTVICNTKHETSRLMRLSSSLSKRSGIIDFDHYTCNRSPTARSRGVGNISRLEERGMTFQVSRGHMGPFCFCIKPIKIPALYLGESRELAYSQRSVKLMAFEPEFSSKGTYKPQEFMMRAI